eukprot:maker-scaffold334_size202906-snap-gene-1.33 protein:Tk08976 transcript:maker-scaffold334_size202906-snap-gene-1.33-mRNA-1 annotation:"hypothetical protein GUITHDRAFT_99954"
MESALWIFLSIGFLQLQEFAVEARSLETGDEEKCPDWYDDYFSDLTTQHLKLVCHLLTRIKVHDKIKNAAEDKHIKENYHSLTTPTLEETRDMFHVDDLTDLERHKQELRQAERQEEFLRQRDWNKAAIVQLLAAMSSRQQTMVSLPLSDQVRGGFRSGFHEGHSGPQDIVLEYNF